MEAVGGEQPDPPLVMWPQRSGPGPRWETIVVLWGWVTIRGHGDTPSTPRVARPWTRMGAWLCSSLQSPLPPMS